MKRVMIAFISLIIFQTSLSAQSLSPERVAKIKSATVKVSIENSSSIGSGFFVNTDGLLFTCWHVIEPSLIRDSLNRIIGAKKIFAELNSGEKMEYQILLYFIQAGNLDAVAYDYCILFPASKQNRIFSFLKVGNLDLTEEGQEIYTCGYPLGIAQQFISRGIVSTKYVDSTNLIFNGNQKKILKPRKQALLDMTMNKGNSGGAIIKPGITANDDEVIGIADFIINPIGGIADQLIKIFDQQSGGVLISNIDPNAVFSHFTKMLAQTSIGVSGCVSIQYAFEGINAAKKSDNK